MSFDRIDSHQHFIAIERGVHDWITDEMSVLRRNFEAEHLRPKLAASQVAGTILVQASETWAENAYMLAEAAQAQYVRGVVGWIDLEAPDAGERLEELARNPLVRGIRPILQQMADDEWILRDSVLAALGQLPRLGLCFDALIQPRHLPTIERLARRLPDMPIVIDHAANPAIEGGEAPTAMWRSGIASCAAHEQVFCKFSGLATHDVSNWRTSGAIVDVLETLLTSFGAGRLMWGSDWPVLTLAGDYEGWTTRCDDLVTGLGESERAAFFGATAARFYHLEQGDD